MNWYFIKYESGGFARVQTTSEELAIAKAKEFDSSKVIGVRLEEPKNYKVVSLVHGQELGTLTI